MFVLTYYVLNFIVIIADSFSCDYIKRIKSFLPNLKMNETLQMYHNRR